MVRHCAFEVMEARRLLAASPVQLGTVYIEEDLGSDLHGDHFEVQFTGGAIRDPADTAGHQRRSRRGRVSLGDVIFDTLPTGLGRMPPRDSGWSS